MSQVTFSILVIVVRIILIVGLIWSAIAGQTALTVGFSALYLAAVIEGRRK
jgi:hypothetical protein